MATLNLNQRITLSEETEVQLNNLPKRQLWDDLTVAAFREQLSSQKYKSEVEKLLSRPECVTVEEVTELLHKVAHMDSTLHTQEDKSTSNK